MSLLEFAKGKHTGAYLNVQVIIDEQVVVVEDKDLNLQNVNIRRKRKYSSDSTSDMDEEISVKVEKRKKKNKGDSEDGTFTIPADVPVDQTTDLTPFWNAQTTFWASSGLHDTAKLGYTYPDFNGLDMGNTAAVQRAIQLRVNQLYGNIIFNTFAALSPTTALSLSQAQPTAQSSDTPAAGLVQADSDNVGTAVKPVK
ncbi:hypothetical protein BDQ17DRAFT_1438440 [Cyathus striatus]|nr:hypothetical protein BDQ17DRAFT_1438440 [Cyathus striatus]